MNIKHINMSISTDTSTPALSASLLSNCHTLLFTCFNTADWTIKTMTDGKTNVVLKASSTLSTVIIRVFGDNSEHLIDRDQEVHNFLLLFKESLGPVLHAKFNNGLVYQYIAGTPLLPPALSIHYLPISRHLARWHSIPLSPSTAPSLFATLRKWLGKVHRKDRNVLAAYRIRERIAELQAEVEREEREVAFCHNDLLSSNIILTSPHSVAFIDYEYANGNYTSFDIANHFLEYCGYDCDPSRYPCQPLINKWLFAYVQERGLPAEHIAVITKEIKLFTPLSHIYWGLWGLIKDSKNGSAPGTFSYKDYAVLRFRHLGEEEREEKGKGKGK